MYKIRDNESKLMLFQNYYIENIKQAGKHCSLGTGVPRQNWVLQLSTEDGKSTDDRRPIETSSLLNRFQRQVWSASSKAIEHTRIHKDAGNCILTFPPFRSPSNRKEMIRLIVYRILIFCIFFRTFWFPQHPNSVGVVVS